MHLLANIPAQAMLGVGILMLVVLLFRRLRRYQRKTRKEQRSGNRSSASRQKLDEARAATPLLDAPPELLRWQVELHETARDLKAELDSKLSLLQATIRLASEESLRLETAIARAEQLGISPCPDALATIEALNEGDTSVSDDLPDSSSLIADSLTTNRDAVYELADQGLSASSIAQSIGAPLGDVELMMSLRSEPSSSDAT
ncbi:MAG: hypothetical protein H8E66_16720 [Planctomycetes bacterium]|nr:hypothetical protein [Planctomycetota bacterium]